MIHRNHGCVLFSERIWELENINQSEEDMISWSTGTWSWVDDEMSWSGLYVSAWL